MDTCGRCSISEGRSTLPVRVGATEEEKDFLGWLRRHGATFDSVDWPSLETESGIRGAIATQDIETGDHMIVIPFSLMMSEFHAKTDPVLGHVHRLHPRLLDNDNGLAVYIMQEILKGDKSFYRPYLRVLPAPHNLGNWSEESQLLLQDKHLVRRVAARKRQLLALYDKTIGFLSHAYPELYPLDRYTFELFNFAWSTVQARAFGKRLKSSALVPLADCLNHGNVQTKYDFDVEGNGAFRLFTSGKNRYARGDEVLNSYGRRPNSNLLLDYGFAMIDNEWDMAEVICSLSSPEGTELDNRREAYFRSCGQHTVRIFRLRRDVWSADLLRFCRCACLTAGELDSLESVAKEQQSKTSPSSSQQGGGQAEPSHHSNGTLAHDADGLETTVAAIASPTPCCAKPPSVDVSENPEEGNDHRERRAVVAEAVATVGALSTYGEVCIDGNTNGPRLSDTLPGGMEDVLLEYGRESRRVQKETEGGDKGDGGSGGTKTEEMLPQRGRKEGVTMRTEDAREVEGEETKGSFPHKALSTQNEIAALNAALDFLTRSRDAVPTTLEQDEIAYRVALAANDASPELLNALIYRVTIKRILARHLEMAEEAIALVQDIARNEVNACNGSRTTTSFGSPSSSHLDQLRPLLSSSPSPSPPPPPPPPPPPLEQPTTTPKEGGGRDGRGRENHPHQDHHGVPRTDSSFASYISDIQSVFLGQGKQQKLKQQQQQAPPSYGPDDSC